MIQRLTAHWRSPQYDITGRRVDLHHVAMLNGTRSEDERRGYAALYRG